MGLTTSVSGNHSIRIQGKKWIWITPSGIPRYNLQEKDLVKIHLETDGTISFGSSSTNAKLKPSIEWRMHASIYNKLSKVNAVLHTHSPYTLANAISVNEFQHIIEEAKIVVGNPVVIPNKPSGSIELANTVSNAFGEKGEGKVRAVIIRNHGVVSIGNNIYQARAVIESLEEWAKIYTISKIFDGPKYVL
jgi:ribulose-5-phosphate 4-epimerase/fuculose-1-phosphate aldolase